MNYALYVYVPNHWLDHEVARRSLECVASLTPRPARTVVVDHAQGIHPSMRSKERQTRHGDPMPTFFPRAELHDMADEVMAQCGRMTETALAGEASGVLPGHVARWRRAGKLKMFAVADALETGVDFSMLMRFGDEIEPITAPAALMAKASEDGVSFAYLRTRTQNWYGEPEPGEIACDPVIERIDQYTPTWGCMTNVWMLDHSFIYSGLEKTRLVETYTQANDTHNWRMAALSVGRGVGVGSIRVGETSTAAWYTYTGQPPIKQPHWTSGEDYVKAAKVVVDNASKLRGRRHGD